MASRVTLDGVVTEQRSHTNSLARHTSEIAELKAALLRALLRIDDLQSASGLTLDGSGNLVIPSADIYADDLFVDDIDADSLSLSEYLEMTGSSGAAVSDVNTGRIIYNEVENEFQVSVNGGAYTALVGGSGGGDLDLQDAYDNGDGTITLDADKWFEVYNAADFVAGVDDVGVGSLALGIDTVIRWRDAVDPNLTDASIDQTDGAIGIVSGTARLTWEVGAVLSSTEATAALGSTTDRWRFLYAERADLAQPADSSGTPVAMVKTVAGAHTSVNNAEFHDVHWDLDRNVTFDGHATVTQTVALLRVVHAEAPALLATLGASDPESGSGGTRFTEAAFWNLDGAPREGNANVAIDKAWVLRLRNEPAAAQDGGGLRVLMNANATGRGAYIQHDGIGGTTTAIPKGVTIINTTAAADGAQQAPGGVELIGQGWTGAASHEAKWGIRALPVQGSPVTGTLDFLWSVNGAAYSTRATLSSGGQVRANNGTTDTGYAFLGATTSGLRNPTGATVSGYSNNTEALRWTSTLLSSFVPFDLASVSDTVRGDMRLSLRVSNPSAPAEGDLYYRSDLDALRLYTSAHMTIPFLETTNGNVWVGQQYNAPIVANDSGGVVSIDARGGDAKITLDGNHQITLTNLQEGMSGVIQVIQDGTGTRVPTWGSPFTWGAEGAPTLSTGAGKKDLISWYALSTTVVRASCNKDS